VFSHGRHSESSSEFDFELPKQALIAKGFELQLLTSVPEAAALKQILDQCCQLWVISSAGAHFSGEQITAVQDFVDRGNGLFLWGDNTPFDREVNNFLGKLRQTPGITMSWNGGTHSQLVKPVPDCSRANGFCDSHAVFTGIETLYEGCTIGHLHNVENCAGFVRLMRGSDGGLVTGAFDQGGQRIIIDGGFTRLYRQFWAGQAGTARFVINVACWLYNWESRNERWCAERTEERTKVALEALAEWQSFHAAKGGTGGEGAGGGGGQST
jgi:hypothetical protein